jgi:predicted acylesterase/phospholipase RssA
MKAIFTAHLLARLESDLVLRLTDHFDLVAGTSAGGIIALALGAGVSPAEIVDHYEKLASTVSSITSTLVPMACEASSRNVQARAASGSPRGHPGGAFAGGQLQETADP